MLDLLDKVAGDDPRRRAERDEFAGPRSHGRLLQMLGELVAARALDGAGIPYGPGDLRVSNPDFLLVGDGGGPVAGWR
ncbi:hypothetical protein ACFYW1_04775 [Streptomyces sp. NPDC002669]|uniref:hypothetical protein n=1 Tax=Streptomyces sp. NPDC002669 TaxID=3364658 RepID=UPI0036CC2511